MKTLANTGKVNYCRFTRSVYISLLGINRSNHEAKIQMFFQQNWKEIHFNISVLLCRCVNANSSDRSPQWGQGLCQRQLCPKWGTLHADWFLRGLLHPIGHHGGDLLPHRTGLPACVCVFHPSVFLCSFTNTSPWSHLLQVLQRQATVFLCEAKTSSQQPLNTPAITNTLQPPPSTFHLPQINTPASSGSQGKHRAEVQLKSASQQN